MKCDVNGLAGCTGKVQINGELILEKYASIEGDVKCGIAFLAGSIKGNVECRGKVVLQDNAQIIGNVKADQLIIHEGAVFQGTCEMSNIARTSKEK